MVERNAVTSQIGIVVKLKIADGQHADAVEPKRRQLSDAFIRELHTICGWRSSSDRVVDQELIKRRRLITADTVPGKGVVHAILIRRLLERGR